MRRFLKTITSGVITLALTVMSVGMLDVKADDASIIPDKGNLVIHSYKIDDDSNRGASNDGNEVSVPGSAVQLSGITYKVYKVDTSDAYPSNDTVLVDDVENTTSITVGSKTFSVTYVASVTTENGVGTASNLDNGVYLVVEQKNEQVVKPSAPFVVAVPMTNADGSGYIDTVHVYPKSNDMRIAKSVESNVTSVRIGQKVKWNIVSDAASATEDCIKYEINDTFADSLTYVSADVVSIKADGSTDKVSANDYKITVDGSDFNLAFTQSGREKLTSFKQIKVAITTEVNNKVINESNFVIDNKASFDFTNKYNENIVRESGSVKYHSAAIEINKIDKVNSNALKNAKFAIASSKSNAEDGVYLRKDSDGRVLDKGDAGYATATDWILTTDKNGKASFKGINNTSEGEYLTYYLVETKAPSGYNLAGKPIKVSFTAAVGEDNAYTLEVTIKNAAKITLPMTGGDGTWMWKTLAGALILLGIAVALIVSRRKTNKDVKNNE